MYPDMGMDGRDIRPLIESSVRHFCARTTESVNRKTQWAEHNASIEWTLKWALRWYMKPRAKKSAVKLLLYRFIRIMTLVVFTTYDIQQIIFMIQVSGKENGIDLMIDTLYSLTSTVNATVAVITFQSNEKRFDDLQEILEDPLLQPKNSKDEAAIQESARKMDRFLDITRRSVYACEMMWLVLPFVKRVWGQEHVFAAYYPFDTTTLAGYTAAALYDVTVMFWIGFGHMPVNCLIAGIYSQVRVQMLIIRDDLEHLADDITNNAGDNGNIFKDELNGEVRRRFVYCVNKYDKVIQLISVLQDAMKKALLVQIIDTTIVICMTSYKMSTLDSVLGAQLGQFVWMAVYMSICMAELFVYCYFGTLVTDASEFVCDAIYLSDWISLSPRFRKQLVIAMSRWLRPVKPMAADLVSVSVQTFISVLRGAYSLFAVLKQSS